MKIPPFLKVYGDINYRGPSAVESAEQITAFSQMRKRHPHLSNMVFHPRIEGERTKGQADWQKADGSIVKGMVDVIGIGHPMLVMEIKRKNHLLSAWQPGQIDVLQAAHKRGAFTCLALGYEAALQAIQDWEALQCRG